MSGLDERNDSSRLARWLWALGPVILYAGAIVFVSSQSKLPEPGLLAALMKLFAKSPLSAWIGFDKIEHFLEYSLLGFLVARALQIVGAAKGRALRLVLLTAVLGAAFGATDELHQYFVPNRDSSIFDLFADTLGSATGATAWVLFVGLLGRLRRSPAEPAAARE